MREHAIVTALDTLERLRDPRAVTAMAHTSAHHAGIPELWNPLSTSAGLPGVALGHLAACGRIPAAEAALRAHLTHATQEIPAASSVSVTQGYASLTAAVVQVHAATGTCTGFATRAVAWLARLVDDITADAARSWTAAGWRDERSCDAACGLTGAARVLLTAHQHALLPDPRSLHSALRLLTRLVEPLPDGREGWAFPAGQQARAPRGGADPGLAHGIAGPLAVLAAAHRADVTVPGAQAAMRAISTWLLRHQRHDGRWPQTVQPGSPPARSAWCYGAVGIGRALHLAGQALGDTALQQHATTTLLAVARDLPAARLWGPTLCHGHAGLLHALTLTALDTGELRLAAAAEQLARRLLTAADPDAIWMFRHTLDRDLHVAMCADIPGLLLGAAGVAAALLSWADPTRTPVWDLTLLMR